MDQPVIAVGPGGSFTAASFLRLLHQNARGVPSVAATPLQAQNMERFLRHSASPGRIALPVAGDDARAKAVVMQLVDELGFDPVRYGHAG